MHREAHGEGLGVARKGCARCQLLAGMGEEQQQVPEQEGHWPAGGIEDGTRYAVGRRGGRKQHRWSAGVLGGSVAGCHLPGCRWHDRPGAPAY